MKHQDAKAQFINAWGTLGSSWGINRTMAMIHALLLVSSEALSAEEVMEGLKISRGNANMNLRALLDWGLVRKELKAGERKDFFVADKDVMVIAQRVAAERRRRELDPILATLRQLKEVEGQGAEVETFRQVTHDLESFAQQAGGVIDTFSQSKASWFFKLVGKLKR